MRVALRLTTVVLLVLSLGLHWALLQTVAWTGMVIAYSRDGSVRQAVARTFDGEHPCPLCKVIQQGREEERQQQQDAPLKSAKPLLMAVVWQAPEFDFRCPAVPVRPPARSLSPRVEPPPKPHPRSALLAASAVA